MTVPARGAPPPPHPPECLRALPHVTSRRGGGVEACTRPEATASAQDSGWERTRRGVGEERAGVCARRHREVPVLRTCWFVLEGVLLGGVGAWLRHSCWGAAPPPPIHTPASAGGGRAGPSARPPPPAPPPLQGGLPRLGWRGRCWILQRGVWQLLDLALLRRVTLNRCLLLTEATFAPL